MKSLVIWVEFGEFREFGYSRETQFGALSFCFKSQWTDNKAKNSPNTRKLDLDAAADPI